MSQQNEDVEVEVEELCPICLDNIQNDKNKCRTTCNHDYHTSCLTKFCKKKKLNGQLPLCPLCRNVLIHTNTNTNTKIDSPIYDSWTEWDRSATGW